MISFYIVTSKGLSLQRIARSQSNLLQHLIRSHAMSVIFLCRSKFFAAVVPVLDTSRNLLATFSCPP